MWDILINFLPIHIFAKDIDNDFRYVFNNRTRCMFYGVGENELNDKTDFDFLPRDVAEQRRREDEEFVKNPEGQMEANVDVKSWNGSIQHLRSIQRIFTDEDGTRLLLGTAINITELEEARLQMQQLNSQLQELLQKNGGETPTYQITGTSGPPHAPMFEAAVFRGGAEIGRGSGRTKKQAEQAAALAALQQLQDK